MPRLTVSCDWDCEASFDAGVTYTSNVLPATARSGLDTLQYHYVARAPLYDLPVGVTVLGVTLQIYTKTAGNASATWDIHPYNSTAISDPDFDTDTLRWTRADDGTAYVNDSTDFRSTGWKNIDLGATAITHCGTGKASGEFIAFGIHEEGENHAACTFETASNALGYRPRINITYRQDVRDHGPGDIMMGGFSFDLIEQDAAIKLGVYPYREKPLDFFPSRMTTGDASIASFPAEAEATEEWTHHLGYGCYIDKPDKSHAGRYYYGENYDGRVPNQGMPGPALGARIPATAPTTSIVCGCESTLHGATNHLYFGGGRYVYERLTDTTETAIDMGAATTCLDLCVFQGTQADDYIFAAMGDSDHLMYSSNGTSFTAHASLHADCLCKIGNELWRATARNQVSKCIDGGATPTFGAAITCADTHITRLFAMEERLYIVSRDDFGTLSTDATKLYQSLTPEYNGRKDVTNGIGACVWHGAAYIPMYRGLFQYTAEGQWLQMGPETQTENKSAVSGRVTAVAGDDYYLYAALFDGTNTYLFSYGSYDKDGGFTPVWHGSLALLSAVAGDTVTWMTVSTVGAHTRRLYWGRGDAALGWCELPKHPNPLSDSNYDFYTGSSCNVYHPLHTGGFASQNKLYIGATVKGSSLTATDYVTYNAGQLGGTARSAGTWDAPGERRKSWAVRPVARYLNSYTHLESATATAPPVVHNVGIHYAVRPPDVREFHCYIRAVDGARMPEGVRYGLGVAEINALLHGWCGSPNAVEFVAEDGLYCDVLVQEYEQLRIYLESGSVPEYAFYVRCTEVTA